MFGAIEDLPNKVAVITNSESDIGIILVEKLGNLGLKVIGLSNTEELITDNFKNVKSSLSQNTVIGTLDANNVEEIESLFENIHQYGNLHVLIIILSNDYLSTVGKGRIEDFKKIIDTNVSNIVALIRTAASLMIDKQYRGHIITISDCQNLESLDKNLITVTTATVSSLNEILRHEFRYMNANIKTTHIEVKCSGWLDEPSQNKNKAAATIDIADMVVNVLNTPENLHVHELWLDIVNK